MKGKVLIFLLAAGLLALAACAPSRYESTGYYYGRPEPFGYRGMGVPPAFYDYDPTLQQWYSSPYFNPYATE